MSPTPQQPQLNLTQTPDYRESYANSVQVRVSVWDFQLVFGLASSESPDQVTIRNHQAIFLSPQQAKALLECSGSEHCPVRAGLRHTGSGTADAQFSPGSGELRRREAPSRLEDEALALEKIDRAPAGRAVSDLDDLSSHVCGLYLTTSRCLRLPYYWDEAGYYIPAAWDFFRTGSLIPTSTLTNAHPPLPSIYLALWWKASGFYPEVTREAVLMVASLGLLAVWRLAQRLHGVAVGGVLDGGADGPLSHLVCPEHAGACGHLRGRIYDLGAGVFAAGPGSQALGGGALVHGRRAVQGDGGGDSGDAGGHQLY